MSRTRSRGTSFAWTSRCALYTAGGSLSSEKATPRIVNSTETMSDEVTPGYYGKRRRGQWLPVNPMSHTKYESKNLISGSTRWNRIRISDGFVLGSYEWTGLQAAAYFWRFASSEFPAYVGTLPSWASDSSVSTSALANARSRGFDLLTFYAEWNKTLSMFTGFRESVLKRAEKVAGRLRQVRKKTGRWVTRKNPGFQAEDINSAFAETWLEARYGWRTLRYDLEDMVSAQQKLSELKTHLVRGYATESNAVTRTINNSSTVSTVFQRVNQVEVGSKFGWGTGILKQDLTYTKHAGALLEAYVGDILNVDPLVTTWEVIPFSFIVDWFTNIGEIAQAYSPFAQENLVGCWVTAREELRTYATITVASKVDTVNNENNPILSGAGVISTCETLKTTTTRYAVSPSASLTFRLNLNPEKLVDLASIFFLRYVRVLKELQQTTRL